MTDGERARLRDMLGTFMVAQVKVKEGSDQFWVYSGIVAALGFVLDDPKLRDYLPRVYSEVRSFGVTAPPDPNRS